MPEIEPGSITLERDDGVVTITFDRPKSKNALTTEHFAVLGALFQEVAEEPADRVLGLTGKGDAFCSGADLGNSGGSARFSQAFVDRGLTIDYGGTWLLPRLIGPQRAKDMAFRGDVLGAEEALRLGLMLEGVPDARLMDRVYGYARELASQDFREAMRAWEKKTDGVYHGE